MQIAAIDNYKLELNIFEHRSPKGVILVSHGMEEYQDYYVPFCEYFNSLGYIVISANMRGHGKNCKVLGYFDHHDGYKLLIEDQLKIIEYIKQHYDSLPIYAFSHSMGTIITRNVLLENSQLFDKVILSGYTNIPVGISIVILLSKIMCKLKGNLYHSKLLDDLVIGAFNKPIKNPRTSWDWLAYNNDYVDAYINDDYCGQPFTVSGHKDLFILTRNMGKPSLIKNVKKDLPTLLLSGEDDTCTGNLKCRSKTKSIFNKLGFTNITQKTYPNTRHVILQESCNKDVYDDIEEFLKK